MENQKQNRPAHSAFEAPVKFEVMPKGTKVVKHKDGTCTLVPPKDKKTSKKNG